MIAIINYNAGNIKSVENAVNRFGYGAVLTDDPIQIAKADKVIFPGVGEARSAMANLKEKGLDSLIPSLTQPVLAICLGQQLLCAHSEENDTPCLRIFDLRVKRFPPEDKVPHIGWNSFTSVKGTLFDTIKKEDDVYFLHSYFAELGPDTTAICDYILPFSASLQKDNFYTTQFHPEKSGTIGEQILNNFLRL